MSKRGNVVDASGISQLKHWRRVCGLALVALAAAPGAALAQQAEPAIQASAAARIKTLVQLKTARTAVQNKIDSNL